MTGERKSVPHRALGNAGTYELVQKLAGADALRRTLVEDWIRPNRGDRILDIGAGPSAILQHLPDINYIGWEPNERYVRTARATYGERATFHCGLFTQEEAARIEPVDLVLMSGVMHHLPDTELLELLASLSMTLKPTGRLVTVDPVLTPRQNPIAKLLISLDRGRHVRTAEGYLAIAGRSFGSITSRITHQAAPPYSRLFISARK
jgi:SAM-dependent methyltransferase